MSQDTLIKLACSECKRINYHTQKNKKNREKLEIKKFCKHCGEGGKGKHTIHKERK